MPHGGGHVGGFSGGGGGFSGGGGGFSGGGWGGGFGHHHHHTGFGHRHHHHHYTFSGPAWYYWWRPTYYYSGSPGYAYRRVYNCACLWFWLIVVAMILVVVLPASIGTTNSDRSYQYGPGDTRIVSGINPSFCSGAALTDYSGYNTTLYSLSKRPPLTSRRSFHVPKNPTQTVDGRSGYLYWTYYMHQGSKFSVSMCVQPGQSSVSLLFIQGVKNFKRWVDTGSESRVTKSTFVSTTCPTRISPVNYTVPSNKEDDWYIVVYNRNSRSVLFDISILVDRTEYTVIPGDIRNQCTPSSSSRFTCSVPFQSGNTYLLSVGTSFAPDYEEDIDLSVSCAVNGGAVAAVIIVPLLFFVSVITIVIVVFCVFMKRKGRKSTPVSDETAPIVGSSTPSPPAISTTVTVTTATAPPPQSSNPSAPPPYAAVLGDKPPPAYGSAEKQGF